jgi:ribonuclease HI
MIIFTDGSTINNGKKNAFGGFGVYIPKQDDIESISISYSLKSTDKIKVTNQISELIGAIIGIETAIKLSDDTIYVYTDSKYVMECATSWYKSWISNNWKKSNGKCVDNIWLVFRLIQLTKKYPIIFKHINSHTEEPKNKNSNEHHLWLGNDTVDKLAQNASKSIIELRDDVKSLNWNSLAVFLINGMKNDCKCDIPFCKDIVTFYKNTFDFNVSMEDADVEYTDNEDNDDNKTINIITTTQFQEI